MMNGFTFFLRGKDYFVETKQVYKTKKLAERILPLIGCSVTENNIGGLLYRMQKANCEIITCENTDRKENRYYNIFGENFGGKGSWLDDGETIVLKLDI